MPGETGSTLTVTQNGDYQVIVSNGGCIDTSAIYTVNNVGIDSPHPLSGSVRIYPNPTLGKVSITAPADVHVTVRSVDGRVLKRVQHAVELSLEDVAPGIYMLHITDTAGRPILVEKVVKTGR